MWILKKGVISIPETKEHETGGSTQEGENRKGLSPSLMLGLNHACWEWHAFKNERKKKGVGETKQE